MKKNRIAIVGYGNIGKAVLEAVKTSPDFEVAGVVRRSLDNVPAELLNIPVVTSIDDLDSVDVALLCTPTRKVPEYATEILAKGIHTVDSYDRDIQ